MAFATKFFPWRRLCPRGRTPPAPKSVSVGGRYPGQVERRTDGANKPDQAPCAGDEQFERVSGGESVARRRRRVIPSVARSGPVRRENTAIGGRPAAHSRGRSHGDRAGSGRPKRKKRDRRHTRSVQRVARTAAGQRSLRLSLVLKVLIPIGVVSSLVALVLLVVEPAFDKRIRREAEANIDVMVARHIPTASGIRSTVEGTHLAWSAVTSGEIERVKLHVETMTYHGVPLRNIDGSVEMVRINPREARAKRVEITGTGPFRMNADISEADVARMGSATGLKIFEGWADADGALGQRAQIALLPGGVLVGTVLNREVARHQLPTARELGCEPTYRFVPGALRVSCKGPSVPKKLLP